MSHRDDCVEMLMRGIDIQNKNLVPEENVDALLAYRDQRQMVESPFLTAVLCNQLFEAVTLSDKDTILTIQATVQLCQNILVPGSWGSREACLVWLGLPVGEQSSPGSNGERPDPILTLAAISEEVETGIGEMNPKDPRVQRYGRIQKLLKPFVNQTDENEEEKSDAAKELAGKGSGK
jgi:hypothetical protein